MSLKITVLNKKISARMAALEEARTIVTSLESQATDLETRLSALPDTDVDGIDAIIAESDTIETDKRSALNVVAALETELESLKAERSALEKKQPAVGGTLMQSTEPVQDMSVRDGINAFLRTRDTGELDRRFVSTDGTVLIPTDQIFIPAMEVKATYDLSTLVNKVSVSAPSGKYPIQKRATAVMHTVAELEANPELAKPAFTNVDFTVETYRGKVPVSQESIDDAAVDLLALISGDIATQKVNTTNALISTALKTFTAKTATDLDGIKDIMNVSIDPAYNVGIVATQSFFNYYDKLKDTTGRYLLQPDLTAPSGKSFEGKQITVVRDTDLGSNAGDKVAFVGDTKAAITEFDRAQITARWAENDIYGQVLMLGMRTQIKAVDSAAGFLVTVTPA